MKKKKKKKINGYSSKGREKNPPNPIHTKWLVLLCLSDIYIYIFWGASKRERKTICSLKVCGGFSNVFMMGGVLWKEGWDGDRKGGVRIDLSYPPPAGLAGSPRGSCIYKPPTSLAHFCHLDFVFGFFLFFGIGGFSRLVGISHFSSLSGGGGGLIDTKVYILSKKDCTRLD